MNAMYSLFGPFNDKLGSSLCLAKSPNSRNFNIPLLTSAILRGLRSVFFKTFFFHCIRNISESLYLKNYCVISFFQKLFNFFLVWTEESTSPPPGYYNFPNPPPPLPPRIGLKAPLNEPVCNI